MVFGNTLIDNSQNLKLVDILNGIISMPKISENCIATDYCYRKFNLCKFCTSYRC